MKAEELVCDQCGKAIGYLVGHVMDAVNFYCETCCEALDLMPDETMKP